MSRAWIAGFLLVGATALAQAPGVGMKQLMLDLIHPASNQILVTIFRGGPKNESEWAAVRHSALTLAESGSLLQAQRRDADWAADVKLLTDAANSAYQAALAKDAKALTAVADRLDGSCTTCHKQYRPNVFPREGGSK